MYKSKRLWVVLLGVCCLNAVYAEPKVKPGEWTAMVEVTGLPVAIPPQSFKYCVEKGQLIPRDRQQQQHACQVEHTHKGNTVNWTVVCPNGNGKGEVVYTYDSMQGTTEFTSTQHNTTMRSKLSGKWSAAQCSDQSLNKPK